MATAKKPWWISLHDVTCLGALMNLKPLQAVCPVCRSRRAGAKAG